MPSYEKRVPLPFDDASVAEEDLVPSATSTIHVPHAEVDGLKQFPVSTTSPEKPDTTIGPEDVFPEGGRGWLVLAGAFFNTFSTFGLVNSWGVFQSYYSTNVLSDVSPSTIAWIGSVQYSLVFMPGLLSGRLFDIGWFHIPFLIASVLIVISTLLVAECTQFWHFMLAQGVATGIGCGFTFGPTIPAVSHWFKVKRSTAYGITAAGSSIGGTLIPIAVRKLIPVIGFKWTLRVLALILLVNLGMSNMLLRRRIPPTKASGGLINLKAFKSAPYALYALACFVGYLGMYTVLTYIDISAVHFGVSPEFSFYLVALVNAGSLVGRLSSGVLSDKVGCLNVLIPFTVVTAITTFVWPFCQTQTSLIILAVLYGIASGAFVGLIAAPVASLGETSDIGRRTGMIFTVCAMSSLCGPPISGAIYTTYGSYTNVGIYAGVMVLASAFVMFATRWKALGGIRGKF